jgi:hypothetical protein
MSKTRYLYALCFTLAGCAEAEPPRTPAPPPRDAAGERRLAAVSAERDETETKLAAVPQRDREHCEFRVGDCKIMVNDARDGLMKSEELDQCRVMSDAAGVTRCMADELVKRRKQAALADLYSSEVSCMRTVLSCTEELAQDARSAAVEQRAGQREREMHRTKRGGAALNAISAVEDKIAYLRATLPPSASKACQASEEAERCATAANDYEDQFEAELDKDDFRADAALALLEKSAKARTTCSQPELSCLTKTLESHGLYPEAKKWVTRNFDALEQRDAAGGALSPGTRGKCIAEASKVHQGKIVDAYLAYVHESVLFFRVQLDKAFLAMHEAQLACMTSHQPRHSSAQAMSSAE